MSPDEKRVQYLKILIALIACCFFIPWAIVILNLLTIIANRQ